MEAIREILSWKLHTKLCKTRVNRKSVSVNNPTLKACWFIFPCTSKWKKNADWYSSNKHTDAKIGLLHYKLSIHDYTSPPHPPPPQSVRLALQMAKCSTKRITGNFRTWQLHTDTHTHTDRDNPEAEGPVRHARHAVVVYMRDNYVHHISVQNTNFDYSNATFFPPNIQTTFFSSCSAIQKSNGDARHSN